MATTVGTLKLVATIENICVYSNYSGDAEGQNQATLEYREAGYSSWRPGIPMTVDRRTKYNDSPSPQPNNWRNQWRAVIFNLVPNTFYEVRVTYTDPGGVSGTNPVTGTIKTRNDNPPSNGTNYYVSKSGNDSNNGQSTSSAFRTVQHAADIAGPGDIVNIMPGTYNEQIMLVNHVSGNDDNYITFRSYDMANKAVIDGQKSKDVGFGIEYTSHIRLSGLVLKNTNQNNVQLFDGANFCIIEDCLLQEGGEGWAHGGILHNWAGHVPVIGTLIQRNEITRYAAARDQEMGIFFYNASIHEGGYVIRDNVIKGIFRDAIGGSPNGHPAGTVHSNTMIYRNYMEGASDDCIEVEGAGVNCAIWGNIIKDSKMAFGLAPIQIGPMYIFRNVTIDILDADVKMGGHSDGYVYIYQNTFYHNIHTNGAADFGWTNVCDNMVFYNNIFYMGKYAIYHRNADTTNNYDYDDLFKDGGGDVVRWGPTLDVNTYTLPEFQSVAGQELHGISENPRFVNAGSEDFRLQSNSPCINRGVILPGFNDGNSLWPFSGTAPDMGAFEFGGVSQLTLILQATEGGTTSPAPGTYTYSEGAIVNLQATPNLNYRFVEWRENGISIGTSTSLNITMTGNRTIQAIFELIPPTQYTVTILIDGNGTTSPIPGSHNYTVGALVSIDAIPSGGWQFIGWSIDGIIVSTDNPYNLAVTGNITITSLFQEIPLPPNRYNLNLSKVGQGTLNPPVGSYLYDEGEIVKVRATAGQGYRFAYWEEDGYQYHDNPINIEMNSDRSLVAIFELLPVIQYTLTVLVNGEGTTIPSGSSQYNAGTLVSITAIPDTDWQFVQWIIGGTPVSTVNPYNFTIDSDVTITAVFEEGPPVPPEKNTLTITKVGEGTTQPAPGSYIHDVNEVITVTANPLPGNKFVKWLEGASSYTENPKNVSMDTDHSLVAIFEPIVIPPTERILTLAVAGQGATVPETGSHTYIDDQIVTIAALPNTGWQFVTWQEHGFENPENPRNIKMYANRNITAVFEEIIMKYNVSISIVGSGQTSMQVYNQGEQISIEAFPDSGWAFDHWEGSITGTENPITVEVNGDLDIQAVFVEVPKPSGSGVVVAGIGMVLAAAISAGGLKK